MSRLLCLIVLSLGLAQTASADENTDRISAYLTRKFGVGKEKAQKISDAVQSAANKYSLPPALLLAIISIESRFKEKARGANGATGLMQVVPQAHRGLLRNVKDLTEPGANIEAGSAILYGYMRSANGDLNIALKSYGGSKAYAQKVNLRVEDFAAVATPADGASGAAGRAPSCEADRCAGVNPWADAFSVPAALNTPAASGAAAASSVAASGSTSAATAGSTRSTSN
ncbi:soluble lytic murein transglycosylase-like protein [Paraburkholderia atlantica]|uniref:Soluble lytic murein transglycosylase-like protein n=1 Tax=Paraburkholderia atlantica TaxID=2654982 RepID=A0A6I1PYP2_PARAM|nr:transglycosylase SLT domain-containing protein [Paraburkholderia atlantica]MBB5420968.1 soluble lytic murein transglycosylase-like protein [Paraburkholderia atlantica]MBB5428008.1 soluble lytic murein transglycosylase-like protein [Paraburkholderia atlantica]MPW07225.1 transglycosylase SLT domain-containing protein [Paraburkholderia atlantica]NUY31473.1 transglycosylase SLT domain-containing protein [Paraburkholderia atlantica]